jgi:hypothetical protein
MAAVTMSGRAPPPAEAARERLRGRAGVMAAAAPEATVREAADSRGNKAPDGVGRNADGEGVAGRVVAVTEAVAEM